MNDTSPVESVDDHESTHTHRIGIFGLGEAGSEIAADLVEEGLEVWAFDPAAVPTPGGVRRASRPADVAVSVDCLLSVTAAIDAETALHQAIDVMPDGLLYADLSTSSPTLKQDLARFARTHQVRFVDVALMATVPDRGIRTPQFAAGPAAEAYAKIFKPMGGQVQIVGTKPGDAAGRKLLRSIVTKGLAALLLEAAEAARAAGLEDWLWNHLVATITDADETLMRRLMDGQLRHAVRRKEEMEAAAALMRELGVPSTLTTAVSETLEALCRQSGNA